MSAGVEIPEMISLGDGLALGRLRAGDCDELFGHFADAEVTAYLDFSPLRTHEEAAEIVAWADGLFERGRGVRWVIRDRGGAFLGTCGFNSIITDHGSRGEIAYDLARSAWGRGLMSNAVMPALLDMGFCGFGLHRIEAMVTPGNERSARVLTRAGFRHEGTLRGYGAWRGGHHDQEMYALLKPEWSARSVG